MNANRIVLSVTACGISLCLSGWSLVSSAAAATIVVTTTDDVVDPPFNASGLCGSGGTVADLPRAGSTVSLREAIIAANNTPGSKTIKFAPSLKDKTIVLTNGSLYLCGGHTTLNGDINGDETPDVTVNGAAVASAGVIEVVSSHNTVKNLRVLAPHVPGLVGIEVGPIPAVSTTLMDNTLSHNIVTDGAIFVGTGSVTNGATVKHTIVQDNTGLSAPIAGIGVIIFGDHHEITDLTIAGNTFSGTHVGIEVIGGGLNDADPTDDGATDNRLDVTIKDNLVTGNNIPGDTAGIAVTGGFDSSGNHVTASLFDNTITDNIGHGIVALAAQDNSSNNDVDVTIRDNTLENNAGVGIATLGGIGALVFPTGDSSGNRLNARIEHNTVKNAFLFGLLVYSGLGSLDNAVDKVANGNEVHAIVTDNTITGTLFGDGMNLEAGSSGEANDNEVEVIVRKNTVCGSAAADIHAIGGLLGSPFLPDNTGTVNTLEGEIAKNTASTIVVENGVAGNVAIVAQSKNVSCP